MNLVQQFTNSIWNFNSYKRLAKTKGGKSFLYIFLLFAIVYLVFFIRTSYYTNQFVEVVQTAMHQEVPDFKLSNGKFTFDGTMPYEIDEQGFTFVIDTTGQVTQENFTDIYDVYNGILITENEIMVVDTGRTEITPFEYMPIEVTKAQIINFLPSINVIVWIVLAVWFIFAFAGKLFGILMLALIGLIAAAIFNKKLTFGNQWNIAIYASTLPILVKMLNSLLNSPLRGFMFLVYWAIAITYVFIAINHINNNDDAIEPEVVEVQS